jgi:hypothetical protein
MLLRYVMLSHVMHIETSAQHVLRNRTWHSKSRISMETIQKLRASLRRKREFKINLGDYFSGVPNYDIIWLILIMGYF